MKKLVILCLIFAGFQGYSQELKPNLLSTAGDYFANNNHSISWSLGEIAIETFSEANNILTQGFQQTKLTSTGISENIIRDVELNIYPNPASHRIFIDFKNHDFNSCRIEVFDIIGSLHLVKETSEEDRVFELDIQMLETGIYIVKLEFDNGEINSINKIQITN